MNPRIKLIFLFSILYGTVFAQKSPIFIGDDGAINGYDPVAFFTIQKPIKGKKEFSFRWNNAEWRFADAKNRDAFIASPEKYAPQFGGYCAYGVSEGHKSPTQPETFTLLDGKLYFNYNMDVKKLWLKNRDERIMNANKIWSGLKDED